MVRPLRVTSTSSTEAQASMLFANRRRPGRTRLESARIRVSATCSSSASEGSSGGPLVLAGRDPKSRHARSRISTCRSRGHLPQLRCCGGVTKLLLPYSTTNSERPVGNDPSAANRRRGFCRPLAQQDALEGPLSKLNGIGHAISSERHELLIEGSPKFLIEGSPKF